MRESRSCGTVRDEGRKALVYSDITDQSVEIFEIRPAWRGPVDEKRESPVAKATYVRSRGVWRVFWQRRDLKWHSYDPTPEVKSVEEFASLVGEDAHACFFG